MRTPIALLLCSLFLGLLTGCYTTLYVNFGNATNDKIWAQRANTREFIEVRVGQFKKFPHSGGDLVVKTGFNSAFKFESISPAYIGSPYRGGRDNIVGPDSIVLNLLLQTNMQIYVLLPGQKTIDEKIEQPKGYPKRGEEIHR